jgi:hypothetical protein
MGWFDWVKDNIVDPVYDNVVVPVYDNVVKPTIDVFVKPAYTKLVDIMTSDEVKSIVDKAEEVGITIGDDFVKGANSIHSGLGDEIKEKVNEGWSSIKDYTSKNYCQMITYPAVTLVVSQIFTAEKELEFSDRFLLIGIQSFNPNWKIKMINDYSKLISKEMIDLIYQIPGIPGSKEEVESVVAFLIYKSIIKDNVKATSLKGLFSGAIIIGITSYICDGSVPEGYNDWKNGKM